MTGREETGLPPDTKGLYLQTVKTCLGRFAIYAGKGGIRRRITDHVAGYRSGRYQLWDLGYLQNAKGLKVVYENTSPPEILHRFTPELAANADELLRASTWYWTELDIADDELLFVESTLIASLQRSEPTKSMLSNHLPSRNEDSCIPTLVECFFDSSNEGFCMGFQYEMKYGTRIEKAKDDVK